MLESKHILHSSERDLLQHTNVFFSQKWCKHIYIRVKTNNTYRKLFE